MSGLSSKIQNGLDEARILVLGTQVLIGVQSRAVFEPGYQLLPRPAQVAMVAALGLLLLAFALIVTPAAYHRIVERGEDSPRLHRVIGTVMTIALLPFAASLGIDLGVSLRTIAPAVTAVVAGVGASAVALFFWYGIEAFSPDRRKEVSLSHDGRKTALSQRIVQVLTEARVAIPGAQAMLGLQFVIMLTTRFGELPALAQWVHVAALVCTTLSIILFMTPAAYHRLVEKGEETEKFHTVASRFLIAALVPLALGMSGELFVVLRATTHRHLWAALAAVAMALVFFTLWFGWTLQRRPRARPQHGLQPV